MATPKKGINTSKFLAELAEMLKVESRLPNIKKYSPHQKQYDFHCSRKKAKLYIGGNRSGKTTGGVCEAIWRATCTHPYRPDLNALGPTRGRVVAVDFIKGVDQILLPQYKQWIYPSALKGGSWETAYNSNAHLLTFSNGSTIEFMSYDQDLDKFAGTSRHWIHFDEEPPRNIWVECLARLIDTDGDYWITMTPVEGMTWIYDDLYEDNVNNADGDVHVIEINSLENPHLKESAIKAFVKNVDEDDVDTRIGGGFVRQGGLIYKNFDPSPGHLQVLTEPIDEPSAIFNERQWLWILALDHGLNNPTAVLWIAVDPNGFMVIFDEWYKKDWTVDQHAAKIKDKIREHGRFPDLLVADPSIQNRNGVSGTSIQQEYQKYGLSFILGNNDVKAGIVRTKKYFKQRPYIATRPTKFYKDYTTALGHNNVPGILVSPRCSNLIWELKRYRWKTYANKKLQYENNAYDEPHKKDDHACDALRYAIMTRPDLVATDTSNTQESIDEIIRGIGQGIGTIDQLRDNIADPNNQLDTAEERGWSSYNTPSQSGDGWEYDEHMGGVL